jgi:tetratricopeptide (TPR) repeat protein
MSAEPISCDLANVLTLDMNPQRAATLYALALAQLQNGEVAAAEQALRELTLLRPDDAAVLQLQAAVALALRRPDQALRALSQVLQLHPGDAPAWFNLGQALLMAQDWPRAALAFDKLLALQPGNPDGYYGRALAWRALGQHGKAGQDASQALRLKPDHIGALQEQANAFLQVGEFDRAMVAFAELESNQPGAPFVACMWLFLSRQLCRWVPLSLPLLAGEAPPVAEGATDHDVASADLATLRLRAQRGEPALEPFASLVLYDDPALHMHVAGC